MEDKTVYLLNSVEEYGKLISYCVEHDISVFRSYWFENKKGSICYFIDFEQKRLFYSDVKYWKFKDYFITRPLFSLNSFGKYEIHSTGKSVYV